MGCPGVHCACCAGGFTVPVVPIAAALGMAWIADHIVEVAIVCGVSGALAVAAAVALMRWCDRRQARAAASRTIWTAREVPSAAPGIAQVLAQSRIREPLTDSERPALGYRELHIHLDGVPSAGQPEVIRRALGG
jgi:uncharacterized membrane protein